MLLKDYLPYYESIEKEKHTFKFTVFTPVYNAAQTICLVYESLLKQTFKDFEWLVINDGSTDNSHETILSLIKSDNSMDIKYHHNKVNRHKMSCFMDAIKYSQGKHFVTFDADDQCLPNALEYFLETYNNYKRVNDRLISVSGLCINQHNKVVGDYFPENNYLSNPFEIRALENVKGEKWGFTNTENLKCVRFSKSVVQNIYYPESLIWNLLSKENFKTLYINKALRIYQVDVVNSITSKSSKKDAFGLVLNNISIFNWFFGKYSLKSPLYFIKNLYFLLKYSRSLDYKLSNYVKSVDPLVIKFLIVILWPFRFLMVR